MSRKRKRIDTHAMGKVFSWRIVSRSVTVAAAVGTVLNAINQGPEFVSGQPLNAFKIVLTYMVPFFVASYGAYSALKRPDEEQTGPDV